MTLRTPACALALAFALGTVACTGPTGEPGPAGLSQPGEPGPRGEEGAPETPSISGITPHEVFLARTVDVTIQGYGTEWSDDVTVSFDAEAEPGAEDIEILEVRRASPTALVATLRTDADTLEGVRTVTVTDGDEELALEGVFSVRASLDLIGIELELDAFQGGIWGPWIVQRDASTPFHPRLSRVWIEGGQKAGISLVNPYTGFGFVLIDVFASPGRTTLFTDSGGHDDFPILSVAPGAVEVVERLPQVVTTPSVTLDMETYATKLIAIDLQAGQLANIELAAGDGAASFAGAFLPPSGRFADMLAYRSYQEGLFRPVHQLFAPSDGRYYVSVRGFGTLIGYDIDVTIDKLATLPVALNLEAGVPSVVSRDTLVGLEADVFSFEAQAGQRIKIDVGPGDDDICGPFGAINADAQLVDDEGSNVAFGVIEEDDFCPEIRVLAPKTGTYYLRVAPTQRPLNLLEPTQWPCVPLDQTLCGFDYSVTVEVEETP